jgi:signal transduction histidine kinase/YHS domain-containing protein
MVRPIRLLLILFGLSQLLSQTWTYARIVRPLRRLAGRAKQLSGGDLTALDHECGGTKDVETVRQAMRAMVGHVRRAQLQERTYIDALANGQEVERARIARELHDDVTQSLIAIAQSVEIAQSLIGAESPATPLLKTAREQAVETVSSLRRLIANLRPPILAELGLVPALNMLAQSTHGAKVAIEADGSVRRLDEMHELALFRCAQEGVWNAIRHGRAQHITVRVSFHSDHTHMTITDDGVGFTVPADLNTLAVQGHYGLAGMAERIHHLEGSMHITSAPNAGTTLAITVADHLSVQPDDVVRDPVCSAVIQPNQAYSSLEYEGTRYYFCCPVCQGAFQSDPHTYLKRPVGV